jgi:hypothetical protein
MGLVLYGFGGNLSQPLKWAATANIRRSIKDLALVAKLTPDYEIGCKRFFGLARITRRLRGPTPR